MNFPPTLQLYLSSTSSFHGSTVPYHSMFCQMGATLRDIIVARTHKLDSRVIIRIPFPFAPWT